MFTSHEAGPGLKFIRALWECSVAPNPSNTAQAKAARRFRFIAAAGSPAPRRMRLATPMPRKRANYRRLRSLTAITSTTVNGLDARGRAIKRRRSLLCPAPNPHEDRSRCLDHAR